jgi:hypothetical protein
MSVGHAMKPMSEAHFAILRRHMVEVIGIQVGLASEELGKAARRFRVPRRAQAEPGGRGLSPTRGSWDPIARGSLGEIKPGFLNGLEKTERRLTPTGGEFTTG